MKQKVWFMYYVHSLNLKKGKDWLPSRQMKKLEKTVEAKCKDPSKDGLHYFLVNLNAGHD